MGHVHESGRRAVRRWAIRWSRPAARATVRVAAARCARDMRGREAPRDAGLARPRGAASTPARLRSAPPPFAIREARLSAIHWGVFRLIETALACFRLKTCRKSFSELLAHGSSICPCGGVPDPRDPVDSRTRGHRILLHLTRHRKTPLSEQDGSRV